MSVAVPQRAEPSREDADCRHGEQTGRGEEVTGAGIWNPSAGNRARARAPHALWKVRAPHPPTQGTKPSQVLLHASGTICRLPCMPQTVTVVSKSSVFTLNEVIKS